MERRAAEKDSQDGDEIVTRQEFNTENIKAEDTEKRKREALAGPSRSLGASASPTST